MIGSHCRTDDRSYFAVLSISCIQNGYKLWCTVSWDDCLCVWPDQTKAKISSQSELLSVVHGHRGLPAWICGHLESLAGLSYWTKMPAGIEHYCQYMHVAFCEFWFLFIVETNYKYFALCITLTFRVRWNRNATLEVIMLENLGMSSRLFVNG